MMSTDATPVLRPAGPADIPAVAALTRAAYAKWVPLIGREPLPMLADFEAAVRDHRVELLFVGDALAGLVDLIPEEATLLVESLAVAPEHQGRGHGRRLMTRAEAIAAELGLARLRLYTNVAFAANVALYRTLGYAIDREEPFRGGLMVHMSKAAG